MLGAMFAAVLALGFFNPVYADEPVYVDKFDLSLWEAQAAFAELDSEVAKYEAEKQALFRLRAADELATLQLELQSAYNDTLVQKVMSPVKEAVHKMIADTAADPNEKTRILLRFLAKTRVAAGLPENESESEKPYLGSHETRIGEEQSVASAPSVSLEKQKMPVRVLAPSRVDMVTAYNEANWEANVKSAMSPAKKKGWSKLLFWRKAKRMPTWLHKTGQVWASTDGKVTFAVGGAGDGNFFPQIGRDKAELEARLLLVGGGQPGVVMAELVGTKAVQWCYSDGRIYCLMAVPTALLPKEVAR